MDSELTGDAHTPLSDSPPAAAEEAGLSGRKSSSSKGGADGGGARGAFPCRFCDQVFPLAGVLQAHMRFHLGVLPHQCNICDYVAPDKATLIRHLRTHSGERPYVCRVCHYPFTVKANCERHLRKKHAKTSRKDIEKNIKYVTSAAAITAAAATPPEAETGGADATCRYCGEDLRSYRALQLHLRTHNGCQRKPFECRRCGAAFLAKRNCIHHLLKQHPEVQERQIEEHIATLLPAATPPAAAVAQMALNGVGPAPVAALKVVKVEELASALYPDQPLDFSSKGRGSCSRAGSPGVKLESPSPAFDGSAHDQPIDLSVPSKRQRRDGDVKAEQGGGEQRHALALTGPALPPLHPHPQLGCYQLPPGATPPPAPLQSVSNAARAPRLKPLLPKPASSSPGAALKELPPLASIAQIIHSVSGAPDLLKRDAPPSAVMEGKAPPTAATSQGDAAIDAPGPSAGLETPSDDTPDGAARKRSRKKSAPPAVKERSAVGGGLDLESSGEFASVEKMLATTDANKFSPFLQTGGAELGGRRDADKGGGADEREGGAKEEAKPAAVGPQSKGKKNAYSNSVQKMTCPYCPRVFPWASSLQRHMLTHTGQKPFPCPKCDAFFSTKSNCERHLLRKHGVTQRTLRRNGALAKKDGDEGSHESAGSQSDTEQPAPETHDPCGAEDLAPNADNPASPEQEAGSEASPTPKPNHGSSAGDEEQLETDVTEQPDQQVAPETPGAEQPPPSGDKMVESADDDDCQSNKSLDLNFGKKLIDFKLSSAAAQAPPPQSSSSSSAPQAATESQEETSPAPCGGSALKQDYKHVCRVCRKSFRYATTLARHERAHLSEDTPTPPPAGEDSKEEGVETEERGEEQKEAELEEDEEGVRGGESEGESGDSEEEEKEEELEAEKDEEQEEKEAELEEKEAELEEKEERSDEETSEPKSLEGGEAPGRRVDKRKKICSVCGKRFWSLQDLTRHMRSHTGERPYQCQTCERTFTLKHSLVRHQRIHLKPRGGADASGAADDAASEDGDSCTPTPTSTCPPSENESDAGAKDLEEEEEEEERSDQPDAELTRRPPDDPEPTPESNISKDPSPPPPEGAGPPAEGFIQGLLEVHDQPPLEHILPGVEPPLVGVD